ncbi:sensor histidine kinase [Paenibacillus eucommiae]|uniref:Two-component system sensor histidine kinase YesM n=1 Tax=Paenibacillus eucommiae TaxID=1355755 RepID=A0ABS4J4T2_9BACL|nr:histidine kinase [Paenibacillus eucommiae]MBP1994261.1 two-component system sensor histidine kinase YesM [Paenibacillus eucommiae]
MDMISLPPFRSGIFLKLLITLLFIFIPIYLISFMMNKSGENIIRQQILYLMEQKSSFFVTSLDAEFNRIFKLQTNFLNDSDLQDVSIRPDSLSSYELTKAINDLHSKLLTLSESSRYIKEAFVIMPNIDRRLSSTAGLSPMDPAQLEDFRISTTSTNGLYMKDNRIYTVLGYPHVTKTQYLLIIELSVPAISRELVDPNEVGNGASFLLVRDNAANTNMIVSSAEAGTEKMQFMAQSTVMDGNVLEIGDKRYMRFIESFKFANWDFVTIVEDNHILKPVYSFKKWLWILSLISVIIVIVVSLSLRRVIHKPLHKLIRGFKWVENGQFDLNLQHWNNDEFDYLYRKFNTMAGKLKILIQEVAEQSKRSQNAELKQLQSQVNPHFLHNSLYIIYLMAQDENYAGVSEMSEHLGEYFKFITQNKADFIPLEKEIQHGKTYCSIQQLRFGSKIVFRIDIFGSPDVWEVPRLIIQPFLENAIIHGHENTMEGGFVNVRLFIEPDSLKIEIEDNGKGMTFEQLHDWENKHSGTHALEDHALWNVHRRLQLRYGSRSGINLQVNRYGGVTATLSIFKEGDD